MLKKILTITMAISMIFVIVYMLGPKAKIEDLSGNYRSMPEQADALEAYVKSIEDTVNGLKPGNQARIVWADPLKKSKTPYSIVYTHGFGASEREGSPVHEEIAKHFGANLYLVRLPEHGIKRPDAMKYLTAQLLLDAVRDAYMIGKSLGDSVIVIGTSMGGALTLNLAAERPEIKAVVLYSPAVEEGGRALDRFFQPWNKYLAENFLIKDGMRISNRQGDKAKYWSEEYHLNSYVSLGVLLRSTMNPDTFKKINQPLFLGYYYKNDQAQDFVVSVPKMLEMYESISTPLGLKSKNPFPESGDHVIASSITSKDWEGVRDATIAFLEDVAKVKKAEMELADEI